MLLKFPSLLSYHDEGYQVLKNNPKFLFDLILAKF
jgi:hypothetical protein